MCELNTANHLECSEELTPQLDMKNTDTGCELCLIEGASIKDPSHFRSLGQAACHYLSSEFFEMHLQHAFMSLQHLRFALTSKEGEKNFLHYWN